MCKDCEHWKRNEAYVAQKRIWAPCALEPDKVVRDSRVIGGFELQAYVMQDSYEFNSTLKPGEPPIPLGRPCVCQK